MGLQLPCKLLLFEAFGVGQWLQAACKWAATSTLPQNATCNGLTKGPVFVLRPCMRYLSDDLGALKPVTARDLSEICS